MRCHSCVVHPGPGIVQAMKNRWSELVILKATRSKTAGMTNGQEQGGVGGGPLYKTSGEGEERSTALRHSFSECQGKGKSLSLSSARDGQWKVDEAAETK